MRTWSIVLLTVVGLASAVAVTAAAAEWLPGSGDDARATVPTRPWEDTFDGAAGSPPDPEVWTAELGDGGWGNNELQTYTSQNAWLDGDSHLVIAARIDPAAPEGERYTSARLTTKGTVGFGYGTLEARIRLPDGQGLLPAFWLLGDDIEAVGYPPSGEIDVVETPNNTGTSFHNVHVPAISDPATKRSVQTEVAQPEPLSADFHIYSVERTPGRVRIRIDGALVAEVTPADLPADAEWVFDKPARMLLNVAIGGDWPGDPDSRTPAQSTMVVDWVRITPESPEAAG
jgi:beta-glucanase (GH16 family)